MKALILAAGYGKRLRPITETMPKSMVEVNETPLLINALDNLADLGIAEVGIVVGHMANFIKNTIGNFYKGIAISYYENERYLVTNNVFSLYQALDFCDDDMLMIECDIYYHKELLMPLISKVGDCLILASPFNQQTMDGTVIRIKEDVVEELVLGAWQNEDFNYANTLKTVNIYKFTRKFALKFRALIKWYVENMGENSYYEKILRSMIYYRECDFRVVTVPEEMWCEIDNMDDLVRARRQFGE